MFFSLFFPDQVSQVKSFLFLSICFLQIVSKLILNCIDSCFIFLYRFALRGQNACMQFWPDTHNQKVPSFLLLKQGHRLTRKANDAYLHSNFRGCGRIKKNNKNKAKKRISDLHFQKAQLFLFPFQYAFHVRTFFTADKQIGLKEYFPLTPRNNNNTPSSPILSW